LCGEWPLAVVSGEILVLGGRAEGIVCDAVAVLQRQLMRRRGVLVGGSIGAFPDAGGLELYGPYQTVFALDVYSADLIQN
jgi:hypothetical protein